MIWLFSDHLQVNFRFHFLAYEFGMLLWYWVDHDKYHRVVAMIELIPSLLQNSQIGLLSFELLLVVARMHSTWIYHHAIQQLWIPENDKYHGNAQEHDSDGQSIDLFFKGSAIWLGKQLKFLTKLCCHSLTFVLHGNFSWMAAKSSKTFGLMSIIDFNLSTASE